MKDRDQNTTNFRRVIKGRISRCKIIILESADGSLAEDDDSIKEIVGFYEGPLGSAHPGNVYSTPWKCLLYSQVFTVSQVESLILVTLMKQCTVRCNALEMFTVSQVESLLLVTLSEEMRQCVVSEVTREEIFFNSQRYAIQQVPRS